MKIVLCTGGYDPIHSGHIKYFRAAKQLGDKLIVGVNSNEWLTRKKGKAFMPLRERINIISNLKVVDDTITFDDTNNHSIDAIRKVHKMYPDATIVFANGGDRTKSNIPELSCELECVEFVFDVGGSTKLNSSSRILENWKTPITVRNWGEYRVLDSVPGCKVKELIVTPGASLSMQRHQDRAEFWLVSSGTATVYTIVSEKSKTLTGIFNKHEFLHISPNEWHQLVNDQDVPLRIIEIQYGKQCIESDIERKPE